MATETSFFFDAVGGDRSYSAGNVASWLDEINRRNDGVIGGIDSALVGASNGSGGVTIQNGVATLDGRVYRLSAGPLTINLTAVASGFQRSDAIVIRFDAVTARAATAIKIDGSAIANPGPPVNPSITANDVLIGYIKSVNTAGTTVYTWTDGRTIASIGNSSTPIVGSTGAFSGNVSGVNGTFTGPVTGTTGTFSGIVTGATPVGSSDLTTKSYVSSSWQTYASIIKSGWSGSPTVEFLYNTNKYSDCIDIYFYISGTSNSTATTINLSSFLTFIGLGSKQLQFLSGQYPCTSVDNGSLQPGCFVTTLTNILTFYPGQLTGQPWTSSGTKKIMGYFRIPLA